MKHCEDKSSVLCFNIYTTVRMRTTLQCHVLTPLWGCGQVFSVVSLHCEDMDISSVSCLYTVRMWTSLQCHIFTLWGCGQVSGATPLSGQAFSVMTQAFSVMSLHHCEDEDNSSVSCFYTVRMRITLQFHVFTLWGWGQLFSVMSYTLWGWG